MPTTTANAKPSGGFITKQGTLPSPRCIHTGGVPAAAAADFTDTAVVATTMFVAELQNPSPCFSTGAAVFNGSVVTNGNTRLGLFDSAGLLIAATTATASSGVDSYQRIAWSTEFRSVPGTATATSLPIFLAPGTYYIGAFGSSTSDKFNTHTIGNFGAGTVTVVNATALSTTTLSIVPPTTFTTAQGCVASLY